MMERGDEVMADRGFLIEDLVRPYGIRLNIPACTGGKEATWNLVRLPRVEKLPLQGSVLRGP